MNILSIFYVLIGWFILSFIVFCFSWKQILTKIKIKLTKAKDRGIVVELKENKSFRIHVSKLTGKNLKLGARNYAINPEHIVISDDYNSRGLIISESLKSSINPKGDNLEIDSPTLNSLIKRAVVQGQYDFFQMVERIKKYAPIVAIIVLGYMVASIFLLLKVSKTANLI